MGVGVVYPEQDKPMAYAARQCGTCGDAVALRHWATHRCDFTPGPDAA